MNSLTKDDQVMVMQSKVERKDKTLTSLKSMDIFLLKSAGPGFHPKMILVTQVNGNVSIKVSVATISPKDVTSY